MYAYPRPIRKTLNPDAHRLDPASQSPRDGESLPGLMHGYWDGLEEKYRTMTEASYPRGYDPNRSRPRPVRGP